METTLIKIIFKLIDLINIKYHLSVNTIFLMFILFKHYVSDAY